MQRLFSTFPGSWPGLGLLILRMTLGLSALAIAVASETAADAVLGGALGLALRAAPLVLATCVLLGAGTPLTSPLLALSVVFAGSGPPLASCLALAGGSLSLMLLGPGAWSLDGIVYGRKRIPIDRS